MSEKKKVFISAMIPETGVALLRKKCEVRVYSGTGQISRSELLSGVRESDGLISLLSDAVDQELMDLASRLKVISNFAVGYNNIDVDYATTRGIVVTHTPGVLTDATADLTWTLLLATARRVVEGDREMRLGKFAGWTPQYLLGQDVTGKILGILGSGRIGAAVALRSQGWRMPVLYFDRNRNELLEEKLSARRVTMEELLERADFLSIHLPLNDETRHLIDERHLRMMKKTAILVNTARGAIVDEQALVQALTEGWIWGAGLDVYEHEPELTPGLAGLRNVVLLPHIGSATIHARHEMARIAAENLLAVLEGNKPEYPVNPEVLGNQ